MRESYFLPAAGRSTSSRSGAVTDPAVCVERLFLRPTVGLKRKRKLKSSANCWMMGLLANIVLAVPVHAYGKWQLATGVDESIEQEFIASATTQFDIDIAINPYEANTYEFTLHGRNPQYNSQVTSFQLLQEIDKMGAYVATVDSYTYVYGWVNGVRYRQYQEAAMVINYGGLCASATNFILMQASTVTFDAATCQDTLSTLIDHIYKIQLSTPTVASGGLP